MKIKIKGFITSKESEFYSDCADNYALNVDHHKFAISDGVSKSFFPKVWSDILVSKYVNRKNWKDDNEFIVESQKKWQSQIDEIVTQPEVKWFTKSQYNRKDPALATFVGLQFIETDQKWITQALGDSYLFFIPKGSKEIEIKLSTKSEPIVFDNFPDYLSSIGNSHKGQKKSIKGEKIKEGTFYLMTDALAEWFLQDTEHAKQTLDNIKTQKQYLEMIDDERKANRLGDDDSAIMIIELIDDGKKEFSYSNIEVTLLSELVKEETEKLEEAKKQEVSSQNSSSVKEEKQLREEENPKKEVIKQVEQSTEIENVENEDPEETSVNKSPITESIVIGNEVVIPKNNLISKAYNSVKEIFSIKGKEEIKEEEQLTEEESSKEEVIERVEQSTEIKVEVIESLEKINEEEEPLDENVEGNITEDNLSIENDNHIEQRREEEKSSSIQSLALGDAKTKSIVDKF